MSGLGTSYDSGTFLPIGCINARNTAESRVGCAAVLDSVVNHRNVEKVAYALPLGALFASLFRYPSPEGRLCVIARKPSFFFGGPDSGLDERRPAQNPSAWHKGFDRARLRALSAQQAVHNAKGNTPCDAFLFRPRSCWPLRPVGTQRWSKRRLAPVPALVPQPCWGAVWPQVPLSARRATWCTARPSRVSAKPHWPSNPQATNWQVAENSVENPQWGASSKRGAEYGQYRKSSNCVRNTGSVQLSRSVEPHGLRPLPADTDYRITAFPGMPRPVKRTDTADKAQDLPLGECCALSFSDDNKGDDRCSKRS